MKISELIDQLEIVYTLHGDIEVTCTGTASYDCKNTVGIPKVYETTVENLEVRTEARNPSRSGRLGTRVRLWL